MVQSLLVCDEQNDKLRRELIKRRAVMETALRERFERAIADGELASDTDIDSLAKFIIVLSNGPAVQATSGARSMS